MEIKKEQRTYKKCPQCNNFLIVEDPALYCGKCGVLLIKECNRCHREIDDPYAKYCKYCGTSYDQ